MTFFVSARRRAAGPPSGFRAALPPAEVALHGAGYPLTYVITVPDTPGLVAQWRASETAAWVTLPAAPAGRFEGINAARFDGTTAYLSITFLAGGTEVFFRVLNGSTEVGTFVGVHEQYDGRTPVVFTYDDNPTGAMFDTAMAAHYSARLWMSPGIVSGTLDRDPYSPTGLTPTQLDNAVRAGYIEPINHSLTHLNPAQEYVGQEDADTEIIGGKDRLLEVCDMPTQSRGRVHGFIYPNGARTALTDPAVATAGHLSGRATLSQSIAYNGGTYTRGPVDGTWDFVLYQSPSVAMALASIVSNPAEMTAAGQKALDSVNYAKTISGGQCIVYTYIRNLSWAEGSPWVSMLETVGAMTDIWSVGYGHLALYQRMRDQVTVEAVTAP